MFKSCINFILLNLLITLSSNAAANEKEIKELDAKHPLIMLAIFESNFEAAKLLFENGADLTKKNDDNNTILHLITLIPFSDELLDFAKFVLSKKELRELLDTKNVDGYTPLMFAVFHNDLKIVKLFIENGANLEIADNGGDTLIHIASSRDSKTLKTPNLDNLRFLLNTKYGLDFLESRNNNGFTPLLEAACYGNVAAMEELLIAGANINATDNEVRTIEKIIKLSLKVNRHLLANEQPKEESEKLERLIQDLEMGLSLIAYYRKGMTYAGRRNLAQRQQAAAQALQQIQGMRDPASLIGQYMQFEPSDLDKNKP